MKPITHLDQNHAYVLKQAQDQDVTFLRIWFTDILGFLKSINVTKESFAGVIGDGVGFDGASIKGFARYEEADLIALPDTSTFAMLPWRGDRKRVARIFSDIVTTEGKAHEGDPRQILRRQIKRAADQGFTFYASAEVEFFLLDPDTQKPNPVDNAGYFDQEVSEKTVNVRRQVILTLEQMGIGIHSSHHEGAPGQHEIVLQYADGLRLADAIQTTRFVIKEIASRHGMLATFMPRPLSKVNGSGMHIGVSLNRDNQNAFYCADDDANLSAEARAFVAGILNHARSSTLVWNQWVNSYRRLVAGTEAPAFISWAHTNRADLVRVPKPGHADNARLEIRAPDSACNPYLALALILAAGLDGVEKGWSPPPPVEQNVFHMSQKDREERGLMTLPQDLGEALRCATDNTFCEEVLGSFAWKIYLENKRLEWEAYRSHVSDWEIDRYLRLL